MSSTWFLFMWYFLHCILIVSYLILVEYRCFSFGRELQSLDTDSVYIRVQCRTHDSWSNRKKNGDIRSLDSEIRSHLRVAASFFATSKYLRFCPVLSPSGCSLENLSVTENWWSFFHSQICSNVYLDKIAAVQNIKDFLISNATSA